jgi:glycosyltransferase involved in cell wall biosynthesis
VRLAVVNLTSGRLSGGYMKYLERMLPLLHGSPLVSTLDVLSPDGVDVPAGSADSYWFWPEKDRMTGHHALKTELARRRPDVVFMPTARLVNTGHPSVVMVRNMEPLVAPLTGNSARDGLRNIVRRLAARSGCRHATRVIAVSPFVRDFLVERWHVPTGRVGVVAHGVETALHRSCWIRPASVSPTSERPIIFAAGSIRPARGLEDLLDALAILRVQALEATVVIAGDVSGDGQQYRKTLERAIHANGNNGSVVWTGSLSSREMAWCYGNCSAFVMTSRVEACPNTALEALAYGALSIATTNRPMPETFGDVARYYEAGDPKMLADQIASALSMRDAERTALVQRAVARAGTFTWETAARNTIDQLALAVKQARPV